LFRITPLTHSSTVYVSSTAIQYMSISGTYLNDLPFGRRHKHWGSGITLANLINNSNSRIDSDSTGVLCYKALFLPSKETVPKALPPIIVKLVIPNARVTIWQVIIVHPKILITNFCQRKESDLNHPSAVATSGSGISSHFGFPSPSQSRALPCWTWCQGYCFLDCNQHGSKGPTPFSRPSLVTIAVTSKPVSKIGSIHCLVFPKQNHRNPWDPYRPLSLFIGYSVTIHNRSSNRLRLCTKGKHAQDHNHRESKGSVTICFSRLIGYSIAVTVQAVPKY